MNQTELKKSVNLIGALSAVVGTVIGAGVFFKIEAMASRTGSANLVIVAWVLAAFFSIAGGLTVSELAVLFPQTGGAVKYLEHAYGKVWGFLFGWIQTLVYYPANLAALSIIWATQFVNLFGFKQGNNVILIAVLIFLTIFQLNALGSKIVSGAQTAFTILKLIPIAVIVVVGLFSKAEVTFQLLPFSAGQNINPIVGVSGAIVAAMFAFDGWIGIGSIAGELKRPKRDLPIAMAGGLAIIGLIYLAVSLVMLLHMPIDQIMGNKNVASQVARQLFGHFGGKIVTIGILISVYGALNGYAFTATRVPYALAAEGQLPFSRFFSRLNRYGSPLNASTIIAVVTICLMLINQFDPLSDLAVFVSWLFYILLFVAVFKFRRTLPNQKRTYKTWGYPVTPIIAIVGAILIVSSYVTNSANYPFLLFGIVVMLLGLVVFYWQQKQNGKKHNI